MEFARKGEGIHKNNVVARFNMVSSAEREKKGLMGAECWLEYSEKHG